MSMDFRIFAVDDVPATRHMLQAGLGKDYPLESFASAEECLQQLDTSVPDLFLLDVGLPGMDGYELCHEIRQLPETRDVPVIFISALDDLESRLKGYDAGGQDFIVKPYKIAELKQKIEVVRRGAEERAQLKQAAADSDTLTSLILSNLDEYAVLIKFLRELNECTKAREVAAAILGLLRGYQLPGAIQTRMNREVITMAPDRESHPLEESIINHIRDDGRIVTFKSRAAFNFDHITVLVNRMPVDDPERLGRLNDHLTIAVECADARLMAILATESNTRTQSEIAKLADALCVSVEEFKRKYEQANVQGMTIAHGLPFDLSSTFTYLGLSDQQERQIQEFLETKANELCEVFDLSADTNAMLSELEKKLRMVLN